MGVGLGVHMRVILSEREWVNERGRGEGKERGRGEGKERGRGQGKEVGREVGREGGRERDSTVGRSLQLHVFGQLLCGQAEAPWPSKIPPVRLSRFTHPNCTHVSP